MIGSLKGCITAVYAPFILLEVAGVGYEVETPINTFCTLKQGDNVSLWTHLVVREDAQLLYGFSEIQERTLFRTLIKINGVGAKLAIAILSSIDMHSLKRAVVNDDVKRLVKVPGIGKKTAERLIIELRGKLDNIALTDSGSDTDVSAVGDSNDAYNSQLAAENEAVSALIALGYSEKEAEKVVNSVKKEAHTTQDLIRLALKQFN